MNFSSQPPAQNNVWQQFKKVSGNQPVRIETVEVVSACSFVQQFQSQKGPYRREMLELSLAIVGKDGKLTESMIVKKIKGASITEDGQTGEPTMELWDVLKLASEQNHNFLNNTQLGNRMSDPCKFYPNMNGIRFTAIFATTGSYNGYFVNTIELFDVKSNRTGLEINNNVAAPKSFDEVKQRITQEHDRFTGTLNQATGGFSGGWGNQNQGQPQQNNGGWNQQPPQNNQNVSY